MINFFANTLNARKDGTDSALKYIMTNVEKRKSQAAISRECNLVLKNLLVPIL